MTRSTRYISTRERGQATERARAATYLAYARMPFADTQPTRDPVHWKSLIRGETFGFLTVLRAPVVADDTALVRCRCGARTTPQAMYVAAGVVRSCGNVSTHGKDH